MNTTVQPTQRKRKDSRYLLLPYIATGISISLPLILLFLIKKYAQRILVIYSYKSFVITFFLTSFFSSLFPYYIYTSIIEYFHEYILSVFITLNSVSCIIYTNLIFFHSWKYIVLAFLHIIPLSIFLWTYNDYLTRASQYFKESFSITIDRKTPAILPFALNIFLTIISIIGFSISLWIVNVTFQFEDNIPILFRLSSALLVTMGFFILDYQIKVCNAVSYIYGASIYGLRTSNEIDIIQEAETIAKTYSYGTACFGALFMDFMTVFKSIIGDEINPSANFMIRFFNWVMGAFYGRNYDHVTKEAYVYSALYGKGLLGAGDMAYDSYNRAGMMNYFGFRFGELFLKIIGYNFSFIYATGILVCVHYLSKWCLDFGHQFFYFFSFATLMGWGLFSIINLFIGSYNSMIAGNSASQLSLYIENMGNMNTREMKIVIEK